MEPKSDFIWGHHNSGMIYIVDIDNGGRSVTNDIENILLSLKYQKRVNLTGVGVVYRDSMGEWCRVLHTNGEFKGFSPIITGTHTAKYCYEIIQSLKNKGDIE